MTPLDLQQLRHSVEAANALLAEPLCAVSSYRAWLRLYARDVTALLAELDRLRASVAELEVRRKPKQEGGAP